MIFPSLLNCAIIFKIGYYNQLLYGYYQVKLSRFILDTINAKISEPARFQAFFVFLYGGRAKYAYVAPTTNFQQNAVILCLKTPQLTRIMEFSLSLYDIFITFCAI